MDLFDANNQWANRPADERFWTVQEMLDKCKHYRMNAAEASVDIEKLTVVGQGDDMYLFGQEKQAKLTNWSFKQLCTRVKAPAGYLANLNSSVAAACINNGLSKLEAGGHKSKALFHSNGSYVCRAFTSDQYSRIWNFQICERLLGLESLGWRVPPARPALHNQPGTRKATAADVLALRGQSGLSIVEGQDIAPAGLYASDHDMFAFMVNEDNRVADGTDGGMGRGFFISNSEVGAAAFKIKKFLYRYVCGNHIVWGAKDVEEIRIVHVGTADRRFGDALALELRKYANEAASVDEAKVKTVKAKMLGKTGEEVLDLLFGKKILGKADAEKSIEYAKIDADMYGHDPYSAWGISQGITSYGQVVSKGYADDRVEYDLAAGKVMQMAF